MIHLKKKKKKQKTNMFTLLYKTKIKENMSKASKICKAMVLHILMAKRIR